MLAFGLHHFNEAVGEPPDAEMHSPVTYRDRSVARNSRTPRSHASGRNARSAAADKLIRMEALWEAAWGSIMRVKWMEQQLGSTSLEYHTEASMAKALGGKAARQIAQGCLELLG